jgi:DNA mismatch endonuclease (patch repair protein)
MTDHLTEERRSWNMSRIKGKDTKPEIQLRSLLHRAGYRFTVNAPNNKKLPGRPDIVLPRYKTIIFVHGCFWHRHPGCNQSTTPKTRTGFWQDKFAKNVARDKSNISALKNLGWNVIVVWECEIRSSKVRECESSKVKDQDDVMRAIKRRLDPKTAAYISAPSKPLLAAEDEGEYRTGKKF